jgi:heat shock protein HslJ
MLAGCAREPAVPANGAVSESAGATTAPAPVTTAPDTTARVSLALPFRAVGQEPGWSLVVSDTGATLVWDYGERRASAPAVRVEREADGHRIVAAGATPFTAIVRDTLCADGMSGLQYPARVTVRVGERTLDGCGGDPAALLHGTWRVDSLGTAAVRSDAPITITFGTDGRVTGSASCNRFSAPFEAKTEGIVLGAVVTTRRACTPEIDAQERRLLALLQGTVPYRVRPDGWLELGGGTQRLLARR